MLSFQFVSLRVCLAVSQSDPDPSSGERRTAGSWVTRQVRWQALQLSYGCSRARIRQLHSAGAQCQQLPAASRHGRVNGCVASVPTRGRGTSTVDDAVCRSTSALPAETVTADIHCVTRWSKLDTVRGVPVDMLLDQVQHDAVMSAGLDISDIQNGRWLLPCRHEKLSQRHVCRA